MPSTEPQTMNIKQPSYPGLVLAVLNASITSFEKLADQKTWYNVKVVTSEHASFHIFRKFEDFVQFSQQLQDIYFSNHQQQHHQKGSSRNQSLPRIKNRMNILPTTKHIHAQRAEELDHFLKCLLKQSSHITDSLLVLEFFGLNNKEVISRSIKYDKLKPNDDDTPASSRWKRLRCTSFLARSPPSATNLSSLCSQAANRIIPWNRSNNVTTPQPSLSTPIISKPATAIPRKQTLKKSKSNLSVLPEAIPSHHPLDSTVSLPASSSSSNNSASSCISPRMIKIKVIYDSDNIIVIQVPRSIQFSELRTRIAQKFSDPNMSDVLLLFLDTTSSISSTAISDIPTVLINNEQDLIRLMHTKWNKLEKVTLRCNHINCI